MLKACSVQSPVVSREEVYGRQLCARQTGLMKALLKTSLVVSQTVFEKKLSFPKHMCEDVIRDFKSPGSDAESRANWVWKLREEVTANNIAKQ